MDNIKHKKNTFNASLNDAEYKKLDYENPFNKNKKRTSPLKEPKQSQFINIINNELDKE